MILPGRRPPRPLSQNVCETAHDSLDEIAIHAHWQVPGNFAGSGFTYQNCARDFSACLSHAAMPSGDSGLRSPIFPLVRDGQLRGRSSPRAGMRDVEPISNVTACVALSLSSFIAANPALEGCIQVLLRCVAVRRVLRLACALSLRRG